VLVKEIKKELKLKSSKKRAESSKWFFKTEKGQYGEGDIFIGITVPEIRKIAEKYKSINLIDIEELLKSKIHEERLIALLILVKKFEQSDNKEKEEIYKFYLKNTRTINNWDLVDLSAHRIIGAYLLKEENRKILYKLTKSKNLWEKRIAIISTLCFIKHKQFDDILKISEILLDDRHDLIHKAVGWSLREVGKKDLKAEEKFLRKHYKKNAENNAKIRN